MIPFYKPYLVGSEAKNINEVLLTKHLSGDGKFTSQCNKWLEENTRCSKALLTHSCTGALEIIAILLNLNVDDEIIMPSFTFVSTANAFVIRGAKPVFVDIRSDTKNINEQLIEDAITEKTKAIIAVHYAGISCEMDKINQLAKKYNLYVIEDAAQGIYSEYYGKPLGSLSDLGTYSFHETKNIISGEGGALLINNPIFIERAEIIREKGTNRAKFLKGEIDKYTWVDYGSSYLPSELIAAFLSAQLDSAYWITKKRLEIWDIYNNSLKDLEEKCYLERPFIPHHCLNNGHMYYLILDSMEIRSKFIKFMQSNEIFCTFHYQPLHNSPFIQKKFPNIYKDKNSNFIVTNKVANCIVRLPLWIGMEKYQEYIIEKINLFFRSM